MAVMGWGQQDALKEAQNFGCSVPDQLRFIEDFADALRERRIGGYPKRTVGSVEANPAELEATLASSAKAAQPAS
jgi:hypothetical protein